MDESRSGLRYLLKARGVPEDFPIEYKGDGSQYSGCIDTMRTWLNIPSAGSQSLDEELRELGETRATASDSSGSAVSTSSGGGKRLALVIGNSNYVSRPLLNPRNDADDMSVFLKGAGFDVMDLRDADLKAMREAVTQFSDRLRSADVGFVYYSGPLLSG